MSNPFDIIDARLSNIENLLLDIKHSPHSAKLIECNERKVKTQSLHRKVQYNTKEAEQMTSQNQLTSKSQNHE
jgi:hypothetical protein